MRPPSACGVMAALTALVVGFGGVVIFVLCGIRR
jgi:hypothetical protein